MRLSSRPATGRITAHRAREKPNAIKASTLIPRPTVRLPTSVPTNGTNLANDRYFTDLGSQAIREPVAEPRVPEL
jgi:hypothetical protein